MNGLRTKVLPSLVALTLLVSMFASIAPVRADSPEGTLVAHQAIVINSDEDLEALRSSGDITGSGTFVDPYLIEGYDINATGLGNAIFVGNTTSFVVIRNCWLHGASVSDWQYCFGAGVELFNATRVVIEGNNCTGNLNGIVLRSSIANLVTNNSVTGSQNGILLFTNCSQNMIVDNHCQGGSYGVWLYTACTDNIVSGNVCLNNTAMGIFLLYGSNNNTVEANSCAGGSQGIFVLQSGSCDIWRNRCTGSSLGIYLSESPDCTVIDNMATGIGDLGIYFYRSVNIVAKNNTCNGSDIGVYVTESNNVTLENNNCSDNLYFGVYFYNSNHVGIRNNTLDRNGYGGINMYASSEVLIENNTISGNLQHGLYLYSITNVTIANNMVAHNDYFGLYLDQSTSVIIRDNAFDGNARYGVYTYSSTRNDFFGNAFIGNNGANSSFSSSHRQAYDAGSNRWNSTSGNYWSDWSGPDGDGDHVVDQPYSVDGYGGNADHRPIALGVNITTTNGTYEDASTAAVVGTASGPVGMVIQWRNNATNESGTCVGFEEWTATVPLADGANEIVVSVSDGVGNVASADLVVFKDSTAPDLTITSPLNGTYLNSSLVEVTWQGEDNYAISQYYIEVDSGTVTMLSPVTSSYAFDLEDGDHEVRLLAEDLAGNARDVRTAFTVDTVAPTMTVSPTGEGIDISTAVVIEFSEPMDRSSVLVSLSGIETTTAWSGNVFTVTGTEGLHYNTEYMVTVYGEDLAGNAVLMSWTFSTVKAGSVQGHLTDEDGSAIANATVTLSNGLTTTTDDDGRYAFANVTVGSYIVTFVKDGFETATIDVTVQANETSDMTTMAAESAKSVTPSDSSPMIVAMVLAVSAVLGIAFVVYRRRRLV